MAGKPGRSGGARPGAGRPKKIKTEDAAVEVTLESQPHVKTITHRESNATLQVLAADQNTVGGKKSVGTLVDELHLFGKIPSAENMFREALGGRASRPEAVGDDKRKWFCSEAVGAALGMPDPARFDPGTLHAALKFLNQPVLETGFLMSAAAESAQ